MLVGARRAVLGARPWYQGSFWRAGDGSRPQAIVDANRDRYAIPRLGPNLIVNASWSMSTTGSGATATNSPSGQLNLTGNGGGNSAIGDQSIATTIGRRYLVVSTVASLVAAVLAGTTQGGTDNLFHLGHTGTMGHMFTATAATTWIRISRTAAGLSTVTNISVREVSDELAPGALSDCFTITSSRSAEATLRRNEAGKLVALSTSDVPCIDYSVGGRRRLLIRPSLTNKMTCAKHNPAGTTNVTKSGAAASVLSVVDDTAALTAAGLELLCTAGTVYRLDNSAGGTAAIATFGGATGNTNAHTATIYARVTAGTGYLEFNGGSASRTLTGGAAYAYYSVTKTAPGSGEQITVHADPGAVVYFILPGLYQLAYAPVHPIAGTGTSSVTRAADLCDLTPLLEAMAKSQVGTTVLRYYQQFDPDATGVARSIIYGGSDSGNTRENIHQGDAGQLVPNAIVGNGTSLTAHTPGAAIAAETSAGVALAKDGSTSRLALNGAIIGASDGVGFDAASSTATRYRIGQSAAGASPSSVMLDQFVHYKDRVSNAALPSIGVAA